MTNLLQDETIGIWNKLYQDFEVGKPLGISYPTQALVICVSNLRKNLDVNEYFADKDSEHSIKNFFFGKCLEIGFGSIANLKMMRDKGFVCHGLEVSQEAVTRGITQINKENINNISLQHWNPLKIPFPDDYFDFIYGLQSVYYNLDFKGFITEVKRVLKPDGQFLFNFFSDKHSYMNWIEEVTTTESNININNIAKWSDKHPNERLRGAAFYQPRNKDELLELFANFSNVRIFTTDSDQTPVFESWWYVQGSK